MQRKNSTKGPQTFLQILKCTQRLQCAYHCWGGEAFCVLNPRCFYQSLPGNIRKAFHNLSRHSWVCLSRSAADLKPGRPAAGPLGPEGRRSDRGQLRHLCGPQVWSYDRKLHLLCSGQPIRIQKVSSQNMHQQNVAQIFWGWAESGNYR